MLRKSDLIDKKIRAASYLVMLVFGMANGSIGPLLVPIADSFKLRIAEVGYPVVLNSMGFFSAGIFISFVWRVYRARFLLTFFSLFFLFSLLSMVFLHNSMEVILPLLFFIGLSGGVLHGSTNSLFSEVYVNSRARYLSILLMFFGLGAVVGPLLVGIVLTYTVRWYLVYLFFGIVTLPLPLFFGRRKLYRNIKSYVVKKGGNCLREKPATSFLFWIIILANFLAIGVQVAFYSWMPFFLAKERSLSPAVASYSVSVFWLSIIGGRALFARFFHKSDLYHSLILGTGGAALFFVLSFISDRMILTVLFLIFSGLFFSFVSPVLRALGGNIFSKHIGFLTGVITASGSFGSMFLPWLVGQISQKIGVSGGVLIIPVFSGAIAIILAKLRYFSGVKA